MSQTITERIHALVFNGLTKGLLNHGPFVPLSSRERIAQAVVDELRAGNIEFRLGPLAQLADAAATEARLAADRARADAPGARCAWCHRLGHAADAHPLPKDHPQYDAFYDATDDELAVMVRDAIAPGRAARGPHPEAGEPS